tara:strand:+ start:121 stop:1395 length:1275 start_codon:yes stop_codon:yes gene_type:complete
MFFNTNTEKYLFFYIPIILFSLLPFFLITGPFLSDLSVSLISFIFILYCIKKRNFSFFKNKYFYIFLIFCVYLVINSLINKVNFNSFGTSLLYVRHGIFVIAIVALLNTNEKFIDYFFYCIFICFTLLVLDGFYQYFSGENILGWKRSSRTSSFFGEEKILGSYLSRLWPIFFGLSIFVFKQKNNLLILLILIFILSEVLIFLSGDRSAFFYINLSAIFIILFSQKLFKLRLFTLLSSILVLIVISFINPTAKERVFDQTVKSMNLTDVQSEDKTKYIFTKSHHEIYIAASSMFIDNKILGIGVKNYRNKCSDPRYYVNQKEICYTHPHNTYIQLLSETGLIGFLFILIALFYFFKYLFHHLLLRFKRKYYFTDFEICILSGIAIYLWPIIPTGSVFNNWLSILMFLNISFFIWSREKIKHKDV